MVSKALASLDAWLARAEAVSAAHAGARAGDGRAGQAMTTSSYYPVFLDLADRPCLVVGGGPVAEGKVEGLLAAGARVTVVSPTLAPALLAAARDGRLRWWPREYTRGDVAGFTLVIVATDDDAVNAQAAAEARERSVEVIGERLAV